MPWLVASDMTGIRTNSSEKLALNTDRHLTGHGVGKTCTGESVSAVEEPPQLVGIAHDEDRANAAVGDVE
jgi:hypothetical protein